MKRRHARDTGRGALDLFEEAAHLLRTASAATVATYYLGAIPFVLGFLYFWADMSRSPFAYQHLAEASLATTALFVWMKFCQASFARRIRAQAAFEPTPRWTIRQSIQVLATQAVIQPSGLVMIPLALVFIAPFAWVYAFYQNVTGLADADAGDALKLAKRAWKQALLWVRPNHIGLAIAAGFGLCIFLNLALTAFAIPSLLRILFGIDSVFSRSPSAMLNTTFVAAICGLTYLCVDPILKTIYALRCFYGESLQSGEDLKADLEQLRTAPQLPAVVLAVFLFLACGAAASGAVQQEPAPSTPRAAAGVSPDALDRRIDEVIHERKYTWRMPRENVPQVDSEKGVITRFLEKGIALVRNAVRTVLNWIWDAVRQLFSPRQSDRARSGFGWASSRFLLFSLLAVVLAALAVFIFRVWRRRKQRAAPVEALTIQDMPDIADDSVSADQLPEDGWTQLARELLEKGEFRLAMRALYLSSLAHLAERNLIGIARFKSNRDYETELRRRAHSIPTLLPVFTENLSMFEGIWYGMHTADSELVRRFSANVARMKAGA